MMNIKTRQPLGDAKKGNKMMLRIISTLLVVVIFFGDGATQANAHDEDSQGVTVEKVLFDNGYQNRQNRADEVEVRDGEDEETSEPSPNSTTEIPGTDVVSSPDGPGEEEGGTTVAATTAPEILDTTGVDTEAAEGNDTTDGFSETTAVDEADKSSTESDVDDQTGETDTDITTGPIIDEEVETNSSASDSSVGDSSSSSDEAEENTEQESNTADTDNADTDDDNADTDDDNADTDDDDAETESLAVTQEQTSTSEDEEESEKETSESQTGRPRSTSTTERPKGIINPNNTLGEYALGVGFRLRENIINLLGYIMYQTKVDIAPEIYHYIKAIKFGLESNFFDVFRLIPALPQMDGKTPNDQLQILLERLTEQCDPRYCFVRCAADLWTKHPSGTNMEMAIAHLGFNPIMHQILEIEDDRKKLEELIEKMKFTPSDKILTFSPYIGRVWYEHSQKLTIMSAKLVGYMLPFYAWPTEDTDVQRALNVITHLLVDDTTQNLEWCGIRVLRRQLDPLKMLQQLLAAIADSYCHAPERAAAEILLNTVRNGMASTNHRLHVKGHYIELNQLSSLLDIITHENYPLEIVLARIRIRRYVEKVFLYLDYTHFPIYKFHTAEEMLYAFLDFLLYKTRFCPVEIKTSILALKAHLLFQIGPVAINYDLFVTILYAFMAPDLLDFIVYHAIEVLTFVLDESVELTRALKASPARRCSNLIVCYYQILSILKADGKFRHSDLFPHILIEIRYSTAEHMIWARKGKSYPVMNTELHNHFSYIFYTSDIVKLGKKYMNADLGTTEYWPLTRSCTKPEILLASLTRHSTERALIEAVEFFVNHPKRIDSQMFQDMVAARQTSVTPRRLLLLLDHAKAFARANAKEIDNKLVDFDDEACANDANSCFDALKKHLSGLEREANLRRVDEESPELNSVVQRNLTNMNAEKLISIINKIRVVDADDGNVEAAMAYVQYRAADLDAALVEIDCSQLETKACLLTILNHIRFHLAVKYVHINIVQYLLVPVTCDKSSCWWEPHEEKGSTLLTPKLMYIVFFLRLYREEQDSLHVRMLFSEVISFLLEEDMRTTLAQTSIDITGNDLTHIESLLEALAKTPPYDKDVAVSFEKLNAFLLEEVHPDMLNWNNLIFLKQLFESNTTNNSVKVELNEIGTQIVLTKTDIQEVLKDISVGEKCYELDKCIVVLKRQLAAPAYYDKSASKLILRLLNPISCMKDRHICPWVGLDPQSVLPEIILPLIEEQIKNPNLSIMEKIMWKILKGYLANNAELVGQIITPESEHSIDAILAQLVKDPKTPEEWRKYAAQLQTQDWRMDADVLIYLLKEMKDNTNDEAIVNEIEEAIHIVEEHRKTMENYVEGITMKCTGLGECVLDLFNAFINKGLCDKHTVKTLINLFQSRACAETDCPWQVPQDKSKMQRLKVKVEEYLKELIKSADTPLHVSLEAMDVLDYLKNIEFSSKIYDAMLCNKDSAEKRYEIVLEMISEGETVPKDIKTSIRNIINYVKTGQLPSFLQASSLIRITVMLKEQTSEVIILQILDNGAAFFKKFKKDVQAVLEEAPVDCVDLDKCLDTLLIQLDKRRDNDMAVSIISVLRPDKCNYKICPWLENSIGGMIKELQIALIQDLRKLQHDPGTPIHIKLDAHALKALVRESTESLSKLPIQLLEDRDNLLPLFLQTVDHNTLDRLELLVVTKDVENYLATAEIPKRMDVTTLLIFGDLLKHMTKSDAVKIEIEKYRNVIEHKKKRIRNIMMQCEVMCVNVMKCVESMETCLGEEALANDDHSHTVARMIRPHMCIRYSCPWLPLESRETLTARLEEIKEELRDKIEDEDIPVIIRIMMKTFLEELELDKVERYLRGISDKISEKLSLLLKFMKKDKKRFTQDEYRRIQRIYAYMSKQKVPPKLVSGDLPGLVAWLIDLCEKQADVTFYMQAGLNVLMKRRPEVDEELSKCPVECIELDECLNTLRECLSKSKEMVAIWLVRLLFPDPCNIDICPWFPDDYEPEFQEDEVWGKTRFVHSGTVVIYYKMRKRLKYITLKMDDEKVLVMLQAYTYLADSSLRRITVINPPGTHIKYNIDYSLMVGIQKIGSNSQPTIDFDNMDGMVVCVPYKNGNIRPLKFDLTKEGVKEGLKELATRKRASGTATETKVILKEGNTTLDLVIDVLDQTRLRKIFELTIDQVMPSEYLPVFFWPRKIMGEPWRSAVIHDRSPLEVYLRNIPGIDFANKEAPVVLMADGIITMDFDINNEGVTEGLDTAVLGENGLLDLTVHKKYMFYIPFPFQRNMIAIPMDFNDPYTMKVLLDAHEKYLQESTEITIEIKETNEENAEWLQLQFDFYGDVLFYIHHQMNNKPPEVEGTKPNLVVIPVERGDDIVVLELGTARKIFMEQFAEKPQGKYAQVVNIPDGYGGHLPVTLDTDDPLIVEMLQTMMESNLKGFDPVNTVTSEGKAVILVGAVTDDFQVVPVIFEDNLQNKQLIEAQEPPGSEEQSCEIPFASGKIKTSYQTILKIIDGPGFEKVELNAPIYLRRGHIKRGETCIPYEFEDKYYYITLEHNEDVTNFFKLSKIANGEGRGISFVHMAGKGEQSVITLPLGNQEILTRLKELAARIEIQPRRDALMVIISRDDDENIQHYILDLSDPLVLTAVEKVANAAGSKSTTNGLFNYVSASGDLQPLALDYKEYNNHPELKQYTENTPLNLKPQRIPNLDGPVPQIAFMVEYNQHPEVVILNPADADVWNVLESLTSVVDPRNVPIPILGTENKRMMFHLNRSNHEAIQNLVDLSRKSTPLQIPAKSIPLDGSSHVTVDMSETEYDVRKTVNTRDEKVLKKLLEDQKLIPSTEPLMMVLGPDGTGIKLRVDTRVRQHGTKPEDIENGCFMVVYSIKNRAIALPISRMEVSVKLAQMVSHQIHKNGEMLVFTDREGQAHYMRINTKYEGVIKELWDMQQTETPKQLPPFIVVPKYAKPYYVFTVTNTKGENQVVILDTSNFRVRTELIKLWDSTTEGVPLKIRDYSGNTLTLYFDLTDPKVVEKMLELEQETEMFHTPVIGGKCLEQVNVLKIPFVEAGKRYLIYCNLTNSIVVDGLLRIPGRSIIDPKGAAFTIKGTNGELITTYLDLENERVMTKLKKVCPQKTEILDPSKILVVDMKNAQGDRQTSIIDLDNEEVVNELVQRARATTNFNNDHSRKRRNVIDVPLVTRSGATKRFQLDMDDGQTMDLMQYLSQLTIGQGNMESMVIKGGSADAGAVVMWDFKGPLLIDQNNEGLVESILGLSTPHNANAVKFSFTLSNGEVKVGYFDVNDEALMTELRKIANAVFTEQVLPPNQLPVSGILRIPCVSEDDSPMEVLLDTSQENVLEMLKELSTSKSKSSMKVTVMRNDVSAGTFYLDIGNAETCLRLSSVSRQRRHAPRDGSLLILTVSGHKPVVVLDLNNAKVFNALSRMSDSIKLKHATQVIIGNGPRNQVKMLKFNLKKTCTRRELLKLAKLTPKPTAPIAIANPQEKLPLVIFTLDDYRGNAKHILLNMANPRVTAKFKEICASTNQKANDLLEIVYEDIDGSQRKCKLDASDYAIMHRLHRLTTKLHNIQDAILNYPQKHAFVATKLEVPVEQDDGSLESVRLDLTDEEFQKELEDASNRLPRSSLALVMYFKEAGDSTRSVRTDPHRLFEGRTKKRIYQIDSKFILVLTFTDNQGTIVPIILNLQSKIVMQTLIRISAKVTGFPFSLVTIVDSQNKVTVIRLNLQDANTQKQLIKLGARTPVPLAPVLIESPFGKKPLMVFTIKSVSNKLLPIILDLNLMEVMDTLIELTEFDDDSSWSISLQEYCTYNCDTEGEIRINPNLVKVREVLEDLASPPPLIPCPLTTVKIQLVITLMVMYQGKTVELQFNLADSNVVSQLIDISKTFPVPIDQTASVGLSLYISDGSGTLVLIALDVTNPKVIEYLKRINGDSPGPPTNSIEIRPPTGSLPLIYVTIQTSDDVISVTIDPNNPKVIDLLKLISQTVESSTTLLLLIPQENGKNLRIIIDLLHPNLKEILGQINDLAPLEVFPSNVIPAKGVLPIITLEITYGSKVYTINIDLNDKKMLEFLMQNSKPEAADTYKIEFERPNGQKVILYIDFRDINLINAILTLNGEATIDVKPSKGGKTIIQIIIDGRQINLDLNDPKISKLLIEIAIRYPNPKSPTAIQVERPDGTKVTIYIDFTSPDVLNSIIEGLNGISPEVDIPNISVPSTKVVMSPVIVQPPNAEYPLLMIYFKAIGSVTIDINDEQVRGKLVRLPKKGGVKIVIRGPTKQGIVIYINPNNPKVINVIRGVAKHKIFAYEHQDLLPILIIKGIRFDLTNPRDVLKLKGLHTSPRGSYLVVIPLPTDNLILYINPDQVVGGITVPTTQATWATSEWPQTTAYPTQGTMTTDDYEEIETLPDYEDYTDGSEIPTRTTSQTIATFPSGGTHSTRPPTKTTEWPSHSVSTFSTIGEVPTQTVGTFPTIGQVPTQTVATFPTIGQVPTQTVATFPTIGQVPTHTNRPETAATFPTIDPEPDEEVNEPEVEPVPEYPLQSMYWLSINITRNREIWMYTFDLSNKEVLAKLLEYSMNIQGQNAIYKVVIKLPNKQFVLHINPYDSKTFDIFALLTQLSTGKPPLLIGFKEKREWWRFTVYDQNKNPVKIELDVGNPNVLQKIIELSNMFLATEAGIIIKAKRRNGQELRILLNPYNPTTLYNLLILMEESKGGLSRPLKPLVAVEVPRQKQLVTFKITIPGVDKPLEIVIDIGDEEIVKKLRALHDEKGTLTLTLVYGDERVTIKLNISSRKTLLTLIELTTISTGKAPDFDLDDLPTEQVQSVAFITLEVSDGTEGIPITLDLSTKSVWETLKGIQTKDRQYATTIKMTDADGNQQEVHLNLQDKQVMGILMAIGIPTIRPRKVKKPKHLTFVLIKMSNTYQAIQMDLSDKRTIIFFVQTVRNYQQEFSQKTYLEIRDDNGQYVPVAVDLTHSEFVKELANVAYVSKKHQIEINDYPYMVICFPDASNQYKVYKFRMNRQALDILKKAPAANDAVIVSAMDVGESFRMDPANPNFMKTLHKIQGISIIQRSLPKPTVIMYTPSGNYIRPVYLNLRDKKTVNKLISMHNKYVTQGGEQPLTVIRFLNSDSLTEYLMIYVNGMTAINELGKYSFFSGTHTFTRQRIQKLVKLSIPQANSKDITVLLNLADRFVIAELKKLSKQSSYTQTYYIITTAYGEELKLYLDFEDRVVVSKLVSLSYRIQ